MNNNYIILCGDPNNKNNEGYACILKENNHYLFVQYNSVNDERHEIVLKAEMLQRQLSFK